MMPHIYEFDWAATAGPRECTLGEEALDNCTIEKILQGRFHDPLLSSEEDDDDEPIDWDAVFKNYRKPENEPKRPSILNPRLSDLTRDEQSQLLKVIYARDHHVLPKQSFEAPSNMDYKMFDKLRPVYEKEQKEYSEWAKYKWITDHCSRAFEVKPTVTFINKAEYEVRALRLTGFPVHFDMAAQIPLQCVKEHLYDMQLNETLIPVNLQDLPKVKLPKKLVESSIKMRPCSVPQPCIEHPCQFIMPNEDTISTLPITEIHRELAQFAAEKGTRCIVSENALRCLVQYNRNWTIPISVCPATTPNGEHRNVVVFDSEILERVTPMQKTYRAFKHLLEDTLIPQKERETVIEKYLTQEEKVIVSKAADDAAHSTSNVDAMDVEVSDMAAKVSIEDDDDKVVPPVVSSTDEKMHLVINEEGSNPADSPNHIKLPHEIELPPSDDEDEEQGEVFVFGQSPPIADDDDVASASSEDLESTGSIDDVAGTDGKEDEAIGPMVVDTRKKIFEGYSRTCTGLSNELPPRSFVKWGIKNCNTSENVEVIVHCAHKARGKRASEIILEPIPEYQLELGASEQPSDKVRGLVLALLLRQNASVLNVRLDASDGEIIRMDKYRAEQFLLQHNDKQQQVVNVLHTVLSGLQDLMPGHYVLKHEPEHGANAMLYVSQSEPHADDGLKLLLDYSAVAFHDNSVDEVKAASTIIPVLLPMHKELGNLPCTFTTDENMVIKSKKPKNKSRKNRKNKKGKKKNK